MATTPKEARRALAEANAALAAVLKRIEDANAEAGALTAAVRSTDPTANADKFARLVQQRDAARGRVEALAEREQQLRQDVNEAEAALARAERADLEAELADLDAAIRAEDAALTEETRLFHENVGQRIGALARSADRANEITARLRLARGAEPVPYLDSVNARGSEWVARARRFMQTFESAAKAVGEHP